MSSTFRSFSSFVLLIQTAKFHIQKPLGWHSWWNLDSEPWTACGYTDPDPWNKFLAFVQILIQTLCPTPLLAFTKFDISLILNKQRCQAFKQGNSKCLLSLKDIPLIFFMLNGRLLSKNPLLFKGPRVKIKKCQTFTDFSRYETV